MELPLAFLATSELMEKIHGRFNSSVLSLVVSRQSLGWRKSSFVRAEILSCKVVAKNMASACKCGIFPKATRKPKRQKERKAGRSASTLAPTIQDEARDAGEDSDASMLSALARELDKHHVSDDEEVEQQEANMANAIECPWGGARAA